MKKKSPPADDCRRLAVPVQAAGNEERIRLSELVEEVDSAVPEDEYSRNIVCGIKQMQELDPPVELLPSIMAAVRQKKSTPLRRFLIWVQTPRSFTLTPLRAAPLAAAVFLLCIFAAAHILKEDRSKTPFSYPEGRVPIALSFNYPRARSVAVVGTFNNWIPQRCEPHSNNGDTSWVITLILPPGRYEYAFIVDEERVLPDPRAGLYQDDGFGNLNTVLVVGTNDEKSG